MVVSWVSGRLLTLNVDRMGVETPRGFRVMIFQPWHTSNSHLVALFAQLGVDRDIGRRIQSPDRRRRRRWRGKRCRPDSGGSAGVDSRMSGGNGTDNGIGVEVLAEEWELVVLSRGQAASLQLALIDAGFQEERGAHLLPLDLVEIPLGLVDLAVVVRPSGVWDGRGVVSFDEGVQDVGIVDQSIDLFVAAGHREVDRDGRSPGKRRKSREGREGGFAKHFASEDLGWEDGWLETRNRTGFRARK